MAFQLDSNVYNQQRSLSDYIAVNNARNLQQAQAEQSIEASDMAMQSARQKQEMEAVGMGLAGATEQDYPARRQALLKQGVPEQFLPEQSNSALIDAIMTKTGYSGSSTTPAAIQEYSFFNKLQPPEQEKFLNVKRAQQVINLGGKQIVRDPTGGVAETYEVTPKPEQMPDFKGRQAQAVADVDLANKPLIERETTAAKIEGENSANVKAGLGSNLDNAQNTLSLINQLLKNEEGLQAAVGGLDSRTPTFRDNTLDFEMPLRSFPFIAAIAKTISENLA